MERQREMKSWATALSGQMTNGRGKHASLA